MRADRISVLSSSGFRLPSTSHGVTTMGNTGYGKGLVPDLGSTTGVDLHFSNSSGVTDRLEMMCSGIASFRVV